MQSLATRTRRWRHDEYSRLGDLGFFRGQRVELVGGRIIQMAPQRDVHAIAVSVARDAAAAAFGAGFWVRMQLPLHLGRWSGPEPDISVVPGAARDYLGKGHPTSALLVIEVSDTTLRYDRRIKSGLYAKNGVPDYWIVNLIDCHIEVRRDPIADPKHPFGHRYGAMTIIGPGQAVQPLTTEAAIRVNDLLP